MLITPCKCSEAERSAGMHDDTVEVNATKIKMVTNTAVFNSGNGK
jgi:hypothetical protein